jgi:hypothetical protein
LTELQVPGEILLTYKWGKQAERLQGMKQLSWPEIKLEWFTKNSVAEKLKIQHTDGKLYKTSLKVSIKLELLIWDFDGVFQSRKFKHEVNYTSNNDEPFSMEERGIYPFRYENKSVQSSLVERGLKFWSCRSQQYVAYSGWDLDKSEYYVCATIEQTMQN